jgi:meso-butanediol dehydrogenase / (S,S)-butanediol dehydrogenase / diacetyl reductase
MANENTFHRFTGRTALVTGAASGIGRAVVLRLAGEGASVLALDINEEGLAATVDQAKESAGTADKVRARVTDVSKRSECFAAVDAAIEAFGHLDVVGNVAGILRTNHTADVTEAEYRTMFAVNADAYFFTCQAAIPHLLQTGGNIVNVASNAGLMGGAYQAVYCMTKGAVVQLTRALAIEFIKTKIRVNAIAPGGTITNLTNTVTFPADADWELIMRANVPRPFADPEHIAAMFAFVASDEGANVHGAILSSDAGLTAG